MRWVSALFAIWAGCSGSQRPTDIATSPPPQSPPPPAPQVSCPGGQLTWVQLQPDEQKKLRGASLVRPISDQPRISATEAWGATYHARWPSELGSGSAIFAQTMVERDGKSARKTTGATLELRLTGSFAGAIRGDELAVWGGVVDVDPSQSFLPRALDSGAILDMSTGVWTALPAKGAPSPRSHARALLTADELIIWGGHQHTKGSTATTPLYDGGVYSRKTGTWRPIPPIDPPLQSVYDGARLFLDERRLVIWTSLRQTWLYDLDGHTWLGANTDGMPNGMGRYDRFPVGHRHVALPSAAGGLFDVTTRCWTAIVAPRELADYHTLDLAMHDDTLLLLGGTKKVYEGCSGRGQPACDPIERKESLASAWKLRLPSP